MKFCLILIRFLALQVLLRISHIRAAAVDDDSSSANHQRMINSWMETANMNTSTSTAEENYFFGNTEGMEARSNNLPSCRRREIRCLSSEERKDFFDAVKKMKTTVVDPHSGLSQYDLNTIFHVAKNSPEAHGGPAFLPFHREYLSEAEKKLRQHNPGVCMPYWDTTLDSYLPKPCDSAIFSSSFLGSASGEVTSGVFANSPVVPSMCDKIGKKLTRSCKNNPAFLLTDSKIQKFWSQKNYETAVSPKNSQFEEHHGQVHQFVGGHMNELYCSPNDIAFYLHHCFVDHIWEGFRQGHKDSTYPHNNIQHNRADDPVLPWKDKTLNEIYEKDYSHMYTYESRPHDCDDDHDCCPESGALWCDKKDNRCKAKVIPGGSCEGLDSKSCMCVGETLSYCNKYNKCQCLIKCKNSDDCEDWQSCDKDHKVCVDR